jgi:hypothetical protein
VREFINGLLSATPIQIHRQLILRLVVSIKVASYKPDVNREFSGQTSSQVPTGFKPDVINFQEAAGGVQFEKALAQESRWFDSSV